MIAIGDIALDESRGILSAKDREVALEPKVAELLLALFATRGEVRSRDSLIADVWKVEYGADESLTRAISILRKAFTELGSDSVSIETYSKRGYRLVVGAGEVDTPIARSATADVHGPEDVSASRKLLKRVGAMAMAIAVMAAVAAWRSWSPSLVADADMADATTYRPNAFLVGDIVAIGGDADAAALSAEMRSLLADYLNSYRLQTRLGSQAGMHDVPEFTLEGTVDAARAAIRLTHARSGDVIWSQALDRDAHDDAALGEIAAARAAKVMRCLARERSADYPTTPRTLVLYASSCEADADLSRGMRVQVTEAIMRAEPDNPKAKAVHVRALLFYAAWSDLLSRDERQDLLREADTLHDELVASGYEDSGGDLLSSRNLFSIGDRVRSEAEILEALATEDIPGPTSENYAAFLRSVGRIREARELYVRLAKAHPNDVGIQTRLGWLHLVTGDEDRAEIAFAAARKLDPDWVELRVRPQQYESYMGDPQVALRMLDDFAYRSDSTPIFDQCSRAYLSHRIESTPSGDVFDKACTEMAKRDHWWVMRMHVGLGELDKAFALGDVSDWSEVGSTMVLFYPDMEPAWRDARFWALMERLGINGYWAETGEWPDFCDDAGLEIDCAALSASGRRLYAQAQGGEESSPR